MKSNLFLLLSFWHLGLFAQEKITLYLNQRFEITNQKSAYCKCLAEYNLSSFTLNGIVECSRMNGARYMTLNYKNGKKEGEWKLYATSGNPIIIGQYKKNSQSGVWLFKYFDGSPMQTIKFLNFDDSKRSNIMIGEYFDRTGKQLVKNGNGVWINDSIFYSISENTSLKKLIGNVKDSLPHGTWELIRVSDNKIVQREKLSKGRVITSEFELETGDVAIGNNESLRKFDNLYEGLFANLEMFVLDKNVFPDSIRALDVEKMIEVVSGEKYSLKQRDAGYLYGDVALMEYIAQNLNYPRDARIVGLQGTVVVQFTIDKAGKTKDFKIIKGISESLNNEALRVLKSVKDWIPALHEGNPYDKTLAIPVKFRIQ